MFVHHEYCRYTTGRSPFESGPVQMSSLMKLWIVVCGEPDDAAGRELDDLVVTRGNDDTDLNLWTIRDLTTQRRCVIAESATEVFWCACEACSAWDVFVSNHENGTPTTGQKYVAGYDVDNDLSDLGPRLYCLSFGTFASELSKSDTTGREPDDRVVVHGYDVSGQNAWRTCDLTSLGSSVFCSCASHRILLVCLRCSQCVGWFSWTGVRC